MALLYAFLLCLLVFLIGALPFSVIVARCFGVSNLKAQGSGNPGATNVTRVAGKKAGALALTADVLKGFLPVYAFRLLYLELPIVASLFACCAVFGHMYSPFLKFKGGKGVATFLGGFAAVDMLVGAVFVSLWICAYAVKRISAHGALAALGGSALASFFLWPLPAAMFCAWAAMVSAWRHRANIKRMQRKEEFSFK